MCAASLGALLAAPAACGGSGEPVPKDTVTTGVSRLSTDKLLAAARRSADEQPLTVTGRGSQGGQRSTFTVSYVGDDSSGSVTSDGVTVTLRRVDSKTYVKPEPAFWTKLLGEEAKRFIPALGEHWLELDVKTTNLEDIRPLAGRDFLTKQALHDDSRMKRGESRTVSGVDCVTLTVGRTTIYLDRRDARPVRIDDPGGPSRIDFDYRKAAPPVAPDLVYPYSKVFEP